jgi:hypothetical protein
MFYSKARVGSQSFQPMLRAFLQGDGLPFAVRQIEVPCAMPLPPIHRRAWCHAGIPCAQRLLIEGLVIS